VNPSSNPTATRRPSGDTANARTLSPYLLNATIVGPPVPTVREHVKCRVVVIIVVIVVIVATATAAAAAATAAVTAAIRGREGKITTHVATFPGRATLHAHYKMTGKCPLGHLRWPSGPSANKTKPHVRSFLQIRS
jgi:hypothetical protein